MGGHGRLPFSHEEGTCLSFDGLSCAGVLEGMCPWVHCACRLLRKVRLPVTLHGHHLAINRPARHGLSVCAPWFLSESGLALPLAQWLGSSFSTAWGSQLIGSHGGLPCLPWWVVWFRRRGSERGSPLTYLHSPSRSTFLIFLSC